MLTSQCVHLDPLQQASPLDRIEVILDGVPVGLPPERRSIESIRCYLETIALMQQRFLGTMRVVECSTLPASSSGGIGRDLQVQAFTMELGNRVGLILITASEQTSQLIDCVNSAITDVLINDLSSAREIWWQLACRLPEPVLTLSLLPDNVCGPNCGAASFTQLRKWQLEQLAAIIQDVENACAAGDVSGVSDALATHVLPWLEDQQEVIQLWLESTGLAPYGSSTSTNATA